MTIDRRRFLRLLGIAGAAGAMGAALRTVGAGSSPFGLPPKPSPPPQILEEIPRVVRSPLRIAQFYDYMPGSIVQDFVSEIQQNYLQGFQVDMQIYTSNEELLNLLFGQQRVYDVIFPSNHVVEYLWRFGLLRPLDLTLLPNYSNLFPEYQRPAYATDAKGHVFGAAYMAGFTGLAYRSDIILPADAESMGWDLLWQSTYGTTDLTGKLGVIRDCRELLALGLKKVGYERTGTGLVSAGQWSLNAEDPARIAAAGEALLAAKPRWRTDLQGYGPLLRTGTLLAAQSYNLDALLAASPYSVEAHPVEFVFPKQGFTRWVDSACIHAFSSNAFAAHLFVDFLLRPDIALAAANWNLGTTPNQAAYDLLTPYPNGWDPRTDPRLYPDATTLARGEFMRDLPTPVKAAYQVMCSSVFA